MNQSYRDENHAIKSICIHESVNCEDSMHDDLDSDIDSESQKFKLLASENSVCEAIEMFALEEQAALKTSDDEDDCIAENVRSKNTATISSKTSSQNKVDVNPVCTSEQEVICLSEDEDEVVVNKPKELVSLDDVLTDYKLNSYLTPRITSNTQIIGTKFYHMYFEGPTYGFSLMVLQGRPIISRKNLLTSHSQIEPGDIIYGVNQSAFALGQKDNLQLLKKAMSTPPVKLYFCRNEIFCRVFLEYYARWKKDLELQKKKNESNEMDEPNNDDKVNASCKQEESKPNEDITTVTPKKEENNANASESNDGKAIISTNQKERVKVTQDNVIELLD